MKRVLMLLGIFCLSLLNVTAAAQNASQPTTGHFVWQEIRPGIWFGISPPGTFIGGNSIIVALPGHRTFVVDPHITGFTAREIIAKANEVGGPVKYLVNTHFHNDHSQGNYAFKEANPSVQIIAHKFTCWAERAKAMPRSKFRLGELPSELEVMKKNAAEVQDPAIKAALQRLIDENERYVEDAKTMQWVFPTQCIDPKIGEGLTLHEGGETIQILYFGRGHTAGDMVVYLPKERILASGDLFMGTSFDFGRDGSGLEYGSALRGIAKLDFETVLPGHGNVIKGKESLLATADKADQLVAKVRAAYDKGEYVEQVIADLVPAPSQTSSGNALAKYVPYLNRPNPFGAQAGTYRGIIRLYEEIEHENQHPAAAPRTAMAGRSHSGDKSKVTAAKSFGQ